MQFIPHFSRKTLTAGVLAGLLAVSSCSFFDIEQVTDPNNASLESVINNPTPVQINALAVGTEASMRLGHTGRGAYNWLTGTFGREILILATNDPRYYTELLGASDKLDPAGFYNDVYTQFGRTHRTAQIFLQSAETAIPAVLTEPQKQGVRGYAHTVQAFAKLHLLNLQYENGIRIDLENFARPGKFVSYEQGLANIKQLLDQAATELDGAGAEFAFPLSAGYAGFNTPPTYRKFNRALAARVALYRKDYAGALTELNGSFLDLNGPLTIGPKILFDPNTANDVANPYFQPANSTVATLIAVQRNFVTDAEPGDARLTKVSRRAEPRSIGTPPITGEYDPQVFRNQADPLDIIRNEELILIAAEARIQSNNLTGGVEALNIIRTRAGRLAPYTGAVTKEALIDEMLKQRRYSLFYEGHRWIDMRRYDRLGQLPLELPTHKVITQMERPTAEVQWDQANP